GQHGVLERLGLQAGIEAEVSAEIGDLDPGKPIRWSEGDHRHQPEQQNNQHRQPKEAGERASTLRMGTHRTPMLGSRSYSDRFSAPVLGLAANDFVTFELSPTSGGREVAFP